MHVGHLRSTVIGDAIVRTLEFAGHTRDPHEPPRRLGHAVRDADPAHAGHEHPAPAGLRGARDALPRGQARASTQDPAFADSARRRVVALQAGDPATIALWQDLVDVSLAHINHLYAQLDVTLDRRGRHGRELLQRPPAPGTVEALLEAGVAVESEGAVVDLLRAVHEPGRLARGADRAQVRRRLRLRRDRPRLDPLPHRRAARRPADLHHRRPPGPALPDGLRGRPRAPAGPARRTPSTSGSARCWARTASRSRPARAARSGSSDLLDDAVVRARAVVDAKSPELPEAERAAIARAVGIGAVKYADLSTTPPARPRLQLRPHARARRQHRAVPALRVRARGLDRRAGGRDARPRSPCWPSRRSARSWSSCPRSPTSLADVETTLEPHRLCNYLYELAGAYTTFYEACPVLKAPDDETRRSRLALCALTAAHAQDRASGCSASPCRRACERELLDARAESALLARRRATRGRRRR